MIDTSDLAVNAAPAVDESAPVAALLQELSDEQLDAHLVTRQGLPLVPPPPAVTRFDDAHPLLDEDCIVPDDQEALLDAQDGWGQPTAQPPQTDSQLIADNESVAWTQSQAGETESMLATAHSQAPMVGTVEPERDGEAQENDSSQLATADSQGFQFQTEDVSETFIQCSETESDSDTATNESSQRSPSKRKRKASASQEADSEATGSSLSPVTGSSERTNVPVPEPQQHQQASPLRQQEQELEQVSSEAVAPHEADERTAEVTAPLASQAIDHVFATTQLESTQADGGDAGFLDTDVEASSQSVSQAAEGAFSVDMSGEGDFPQTQAPDTQNGFQDGDNETIDDATPAQTQARANDSVISQDTGHSEPTTVLGDVEEIVTDEDPSDERAFVDDHRQPMTQAPDTVDDDVRGSPPRVRKRLRRSASSDGDDDSIQSTPTMTTGVADEVPGSILPNTRRRTTHAASPALEPEGRREESSPPLQPAALPSQRTSLTTPETTTLSAASPAATTFSAVERLPPARSQAPPSARLKVSAHEPTRRSTSGAPAPAREGVTTSSAPAVSAPSTPTVSPRFAERRTPPAPQTTPLSAAKLALKSYFRTGVPLSIQQRDSLLFPKHPRRDDDLLHFFQDSVALPNPDDRQHTRMDRSGPGARPRSGKLPSGRTAAGRWRGSERGTTGVL